MADQVGTRGFVEPEERKATGLLVALALLALALLLAVVQSGPPSPKGTDAPAPEFSAGRALEVQRGFMGDGAPHPAGTPANARVREKILAQLRNLGYAPEVQQAFACSPGGNCARVSNVLARLQGREPGKSVLLMAHYDSVAAGPGAGDDGAGVAAVLEVARILKAGPPPRHGVMLLISDGEELGLLGARAFAEQSPAVAEVGAVVNLEARGTGGPSLMFETSGPDAWLVSRWAGGASKPFTSSLFSTIYRYMPNDTDLTVFRRRNIPGMNFAFIDGPAHYHTPLDNLQNLSPGSLQHHGDNALAAVRGLANSEAGNLGNPPQGQAVFFDFLRATVVRWPAGLSPLLGLLALVLVAAAVVMARRRGPAGAMSWGAVALGLLIPLAALILTLVLAIGLQALLAGAFPNFWVARPLPAMAAFWLLALAASVGAAGLLARRSNAAGIWAGVWIFWSVVSLVLGLLLPGASYLFLVPALVAGVSGLALSGSPGGRTAAAILPVFVAALLWFPTLRALYLGLGLQGLVATAILLSFVFGALAPLVPRRGSRWVLLTAGGAAVLCAVIAMVSPPFSPDSPRPMTVQLHQDGDSGKSQWIVRGTPPFPPAMRDAAKFAPQPGPAFPWSPPMARSFLAPAPPLNAPAPTLAVVEDASAGGKRRLRLRFTSTRGAPMGTLVVPAAAKLESIKIDGQVISLDRPMGARGPAPDWRQFTNYTVPPEGSEIEVVLGAAQPLDWYVFDRSYGLPPVGQALIAARPKDAVAVQDGDLTTVSRKVRI